MSWRLGEFTLVGVPVQFLLQEEAVRALGGNSGSSQDQFCTCRKTSECLCVAGTAGRPTPASIPGCASVLLLPALPDTEYGSCAFSGAAA